MNNSKFDFLFSSSDPVVNFYHYTLETVYGDFKFSLLSNE